MMRHIASSCVGRRTLALPITPMRLPIIIRPTTYTPTYTNARSLHSHTVALSFSPSSSLQFRHQQQQQQQQQHPTPSKNPLPTQMVGTIAPPRLVWEFTGAPNFYRMSVLNAGQAMFWGFMYGLSFVEADVPMWWGALGLTMSGAFAGAIWLRARRVITEVAIYSDNHTFRIRSNTWNNKPYFQDVKLSQVGPNPNPRPKDGTSPKLFGLQIHGTKGFHLLDRNGEIFDLYNFNRLLGYDARDTLPFGDELNLSRSARQQIRDAQFAPKGSPTEQQEPVSFERKRK